MARPTQITDEAILDALAADPEVTAAELADRLGMGQSTAAKRLAALEAPARSGAPRRAGERRPGRRPLVERHRRPGTPEPLNPDADGGGHRPRRYPRRRPSRSRRAAGPGRARVPGARLPGRPARRGVRARPRWARPSGGPRGRSPTRWRPWPPAARWSWSSDKPRRYRIASRPAAATRTPRPGPRGYGLPRLGVGRTPTWGSRPRRRTPRRRRGTPENFSTVRPGGSRPSTPLGVSEPRPADQPRRGGAARSTPRLPRDVGSRGLAGAGSIRDNTG